MFSAYDSCHDICVAVAYALVRTAPHTETCSCKTREIYYKMISSTFFSRSDISNNLLHISHL